MPETMELFREQAAGGCPQCNMAGGVIPVVRTRATPQLREKQRKGKILLEDPGRACGGSWYCKNCGGQW